MYIYDEACEEEAVKALRHEIIDHLITSRIVKPLAGLVNLLIRSKEAEIHKEKIVEAVAKLIPERLNNQTAKKKHATEGGIVRYTRAGVT